MCDYYMPTDKQHDSQLIDQYFMLMRIREPAVRENAVDTLKAIDKEISCIKLKLKPLTLSDFEESKN